MKTTTNSPAREILKINGHEYVALEVEPSVRRWDVPTLFAGQIVTYAFSAAGPAEGGPGSRYVRKFDRSDREVRYFELAR